MTGTWNVKLGSLWRTYKVRGARAAPFVKAGALTATDGGLELTSRYDPPGSGWLAFGAAIVTGIIVVVAAQQLGFCAGPGWLLWFIGIAMLRRRTVTLNLPEADQAILDPANRRLAFHLNFQGKPRWVAVEVPQNFDEAAQAVAIQLPGRVVQENIDRALTSGSIALLVLAILFGVMILLSIVAVFIFTLRRRPVPQRITSMLIPTGSWALVVNGLQGFVRRIRCTSE